MKYLLVFLIAVSAFAVEPVEQKVTIPVGGGLNTRSSDFDIKPNECRQAHEVDFSRLLGGISKRRGYGTVSSLGTGYDSLLGLFGAYYSDATKRLAFAADSTGVGWGGVYVGDTARGTINSGTTRIARYWNTQYPTTFAMFDDKLYATNGVQKGVVWDGKNARSFPLAAPGEPKIVPIEGYTGVYKLNGEYRYLIIASMYPGDVTMYKGYLASPVKVTNGRVLLTDFWFPQVDSVNDTITACSLSIYRTKVNPGRLDATDSVYRIIAGKVIGADSPSFADAYYIDSIPEDTVMARVPASILDLTGQPKYGYDSMGSIKRRYGAPSYLYETTYVYTGNSDTETVTSGIHAGIYKGISQVRRGKSDGILYACTYFDTLNHQESDTGRSLFVAARDSGRADTMIYRVRVGLPTIPDSVVGVTRNLYKAYLIPLGADSGMLVSARKYNGYLLSRMRALVEANAWVLAQNRKLGWDAYYVIPDTANRQIKIYMHGLTTDSTITTPFFFVATIPAESSAYTDSTRYDSLLARQIYTGQTPPHLLNNIFAHAGRMWGTSGANLYWSIVDSAQYWGAFNSVSVNPDDGDQITAAWPTRRAIRVFKNKSSWNVYQDADLNWSLSEVTSNIGCIAPKSHVAGVNGHYYLSSEGFIRETEGAYLERTSNAVLISAKLDNFEKLPITTLEKCYGTYIDGKCLWTIGDTTYVYDEKADAWSTWGFKIGGATMYNAGSHVKSLPGDTLYFYKPNGKTVFAYDAIEEDSSARPGLSVVAVRLRWKSAPLLLSSRQKILTAIGTWSSGSDTSSISGWVYDQDGTSLAGNITFGDNATHRYQRSAVRSATPALYYQLQLDSYTTNTWSVNGFDLWFHDVGDSELE